MAKSIVPQQPKKKSRRSLKKIVLIAVGALAVLAFTGFAFSKTDSGREVTSLISSKVGSVFGGDNDNDSVSLSGCSEQTLRYVREALVYPYDLEVLRAGYESIVADETYKSNAACVYVVTEYNLQIGDSGGARTAYDLLENVYDEEVGYGEELAGYTLGLSTLSDKVERAESSSLINPGSINRGEGIYYGPLDEQPAAN